MEDPDATPMSSLFLPSKRHYGHQTSSSSSSSETSMTGTQTSFTSSSSPTHARLYLTVDCGGSKAAAAISSSSPGGGPPVFLSRGFGGAANYTDLGLHRFLKSVRKAVENALDQAGIDWQAMLSTEQLARGHSGGSKNPKTNGLPPISAKISPSMSPASIYSNLSDGNEEAAEDLPFSFPPIFHAAWLGIAGVDSPHNISALSPHLSTLLAIPYPSPRLIVANDSSLLASPVMEGEAQEDTGVREGVVCIAGTGSIVMSFRSRPRHQNPPSTPTAATDSSHNDSPTGSMSSSSLASAGGLLEAVGRVGGLGWLLGDEAGGYVVGKKAVRAVLDQADRERLGIDDDDDDDDSEEENDSQASPMERPHLESHQQDSTRLTSTNLSSAATSTRIDKKHLLRDRVLAHWGLSSTNDILDTVYANDDFVISTASTGTGGHRASVNPSVASSVNGAHDDSDSNSSGRSTPAAARLDIVASSDAAGAGLAALSESTPLPPGFRLEPSSPTISRDDIRGGTSPIAAIPSYPSSPKPEARRAQAADAAVGLQAGTGGTASTSDLPSTNSSIEAAAPRRPSLMTEMFEGLMTSKTSGSSSSSSSLHYPSSSSSSSSSPSPVEPSQTSMERRQTLRGGSAAEDRMVRPNQDAHHNQCQQGAKMETNNSPNQQQPQGFVRKLRLASLAPLVFHLAFTHGDPLSLSILRNEIRKLVRQIQLLCQREEDATGSNKTQSRPWTRDPRRIRPLYSTLCLGGSLLSVEAYRSLLIEELAKQGWKFGKVVYVQDVARRGSEALAKGWEE